MGRHNVELGPDARLIAAISTLFTDGKLLLVLHSVVKSVQVPHPLERQLTVGYMDLCYSEALWTSKTQYPALAPKIRLCVGRAIRPEEKADSFLQMLLADVQA